MSDDKGKKIIDCVARFEHLPVDTSKFSDRKKECIESCYKTIMNEKIKLKRWQKCGFGHKNLRVLDFNSISKGSYSEIGITLECLECKSRQRWGASLSVENLRDDDDFPYDKTKKMCNLSDDYLRWFRKQSFAHLYPEVLAYMNRKGIIWSAAGGVWDDYKPA